MTNERRSRNATVFEYKRHIEFPEDFERIDPGLETSSFVAEEARVLADGVEEFPRTGWAGEFVVADLDWIAILGPGGDEQKPKAKHDPDHTDETDYPDV